jgi:predicted enzyme related to lactoylglutathione lyase
MLSSARVHAALPASDLERARAFYEGTLGLTPERVFPGGVFYAMGEGTRFFIFPSSGKASGAHTQMGFRVADIESEMTDLKARGVVFEEYDMPAFDKATSIATFEFNRSAWFKDTEGNLLGLVQFLTEMP